MGSSQQKQQVDRARTGGQDAAEARERQRRFGDRVAAHDATQPGYGAAWARLRARLVDAGGAEVVPPLVADAHLDQLCSDRLAVRPGPGRMLRGQPNACHENTARAWLDGRVEHIETGYALTADDGLWRQHTWGVRTGPRGRVTVVETTSQRDLYAGIRLDPLETVAFVLGNAGEDAFLAALAHPVRGPQLYELMVDIDLDD